MESNVWSVRIGKLRSLNLVDGKPETQEHLAKELTKILGRNVSREVVNQWESGTRNLKADVIIALSKHFGCTADYILGLHSAPTNDIELSAICKYTGLSEKSIENLRLYTHDYLHTSKDILQYVVDGLLSSDDFIRLLLGFREFWVKQEILNRVLREESGETDEQAAAYALAGIHIAERDLAFQRYTVKESLDLFFNELFDANGVMEATRGKESELTELLNGKRGTDNAE